MTRGILKPALLFSSTLVLLLGCAIFTGSLQAAAASSNAVQYCQHQTTTKGACEQGYDGGVGQPPAKTVDDACQSLSGDNLNACQSAWAAAAHEDAAVYCSASKCDFIGKYVNPAITALTAAFGLIAVASLIMGGIQFSTSEGDPQKASRAKTRITNTIIAIVAYSLLYGFLQFLVPGGFLHG